MIAKEPFRLAVQMTNNRRSHRDFHTLKSARHYAKSICNNLNVVTISVAGPEIVQTLYERNVK